MLISYLVPVFNKDRFIEPVLRAIVGQIGEFEREIIVIDDGSSDGTAGILARLAAEIPSIRLIRLEDEGPAVALNRAATMASGQFFKFVDGDDLLLPNGTQQLVDAATSTGSVMAFGTCNVYASEDLPNVALPPAPKLAIRTMTEPLPEMIEKIDLTMSGAMVTADAFRAVGGCDERVFVHDAPLFLRLAQRGSFAQLQGAVARMPAADPQRWSNRAQGQVLHDVNKALYYLVAETPDLAPVLRRAAFQRAAGRAWKWAHRHGGAGIGSRYFPSQCEQQDSRLAGNHRSDGRNVWRLPGNSGGARTGRRSHNDLIQRRRRRPKGSLIFHNIPYAPNGRRERWAALRPSHPFVV